MLENTLREISDNVKLFIPPHDRVAGWRRSGNVVLLNKDKELCIIDSGGPSVRSQLVSIVDNAMTERTKHIQCLHTHGHIDHMAGARELKNRFSADILASREAIPFIKSQVPLNIELEQDSLIVSFRELFTAPQWFVRGAMYVALGRTHPLSSVSSFDERILADELGLIPVELPGHHKGHYGFKIDEGNILLVGDLIDPRHKMKPILTSPSSNFAKLKNSLEIVLQINPEILLPGHGEPIIGADNIQDAIHDAQNIMKTAQDRIVEILESESYALSELSSLMQGMGLGPGDVFRRMFIHSVLHYLVEIGKVSKQLTSRGRTLFSI